LYCLIINAGYEELAAWATHDGPRLLQQLSCKLCVQLLQKVPLHCYCQLLLQVL
jgi:hypothetical protein